MLFYGGIAGGVVLDRAVARRAPANLNRYLFGASPPRPDADLVTFAMLAVVILAVTALGRRCSP